MAEATFQLSLQTSSPLWRWDHVGNDSSKSWTVLCSELVSSYKCDDHIAQSTSTASSANLTFYGTEVALFGNATGGMSWSASVDGSNTKNSDSSSGFSSTLASWTGLSSGEHVLTLSTTPTASGSVLTLDHAEVTVGLGVSGSNVTMTYVDDTDPQITYSSSNWHLYNEYENTDRPPTVNNLNFTGSNDLGDRASLVFNASAIVVVGPCYLACGAYTVSIDSEKAVQYNGSWDTPTEISEACVRYARSGLDPTKTHAITITQAQQGAITTIDWIQLVHVANGTSGQGTPSPTTSSHPSGSSHHKTSPAAAVAGGVVGGVGAIVIAAVLFLMYRRRRRRNDLTAKPSPYTGEKPVDGEAAGVAVLPHDSHDPASSFPPDSHWAGLVNVTDHRSLPKTSTTSGSVRQHPTGAQTASTDSTGHPITPTTPGETNSQPQTSPVNLAAFSPHRVDYRPPEKTNAPPPSTIASSRGVGPAPHSNPSTADLARVPEDGSRDRSPTISSYPIGSVSDESSQRHALGGAAPAAGITLNQISQDVNRILTHLGRLRITPGEPVEEGDAEVDPHQAHPTHDHEVDDGTNPPEYGEDGVEIPHPHPAQHQGPPSNSS